MTLYAVNAVYAERVGTYRVYGVYRVRAQDPTSRVPGRHRTLPRPPSVVGPPSEARNV